MERYKTSTLKLIKISLIVLLSLLLVSVTLPSLIENTSYVAYATNGDYKEEVGDGDESDENLQGSGGSTGDSFGTGGTGGYNAGNEGIILYMVDDNGSVVSRPVVVVYDDANTMLFEDEFYGYRWSDNTVMTHTAIGNKSVDMYNYYLMSDIDSLTGFPHLTLSYGSGMISNTAAVSDFMLTVGERDALNVNYVIAELFNPGGIGAYTGYYNGKKMYDAYMDDGNLNLIVEGFWWYVPAKYDSTSGGSVGADFDESTPGLNYVVGDTQFLAKLNVANHDKIHSPGAANKGGYMHYNSTVFPTSLMFNEDEPGIAVIPSKTAGTVYQDEILEKVGGQTQAYGMALYEPEQTIETWFTWKGTRSYYRDGEKITETVGGGNPPVDAPKQADADEDVDIFNVKIIKIYETIKIKTDGTQEVVETKIPPNWSSQACVRVIEVQEEPGYTLAHWFTSDYGPDLSNGWKSAEKNYNYAPGDQKGMSPTTVEVRRYTGGNSWDFLTVHLVKYIVEEVEEKNEIVLNESEITHTYNTKSVTDMGPVTLTYNYGSMSGTCTVDVFSHYTYEDVPYGCDDGCKTWSYTENKITWKPYHGGSDCPDKGSYQVRHAHYKDCGKSFELGSMADKGYNYVWKPGTVSTKKIVAYTDPDKTTIFNPKADKSTATNYNGTVSSISGGSIDVENAAIIFVAWRGNSDIPTRADYHSVGTEIDTLIGTAQNNTANNTRRAGQGMYTETATIKFINDNSAANGADLTTKAVCPSHSTTGKSVTHTLSSTPSVSAEAKVYYYSGQQKSPATTYPNLTQIITKNFGTGAQGSSTNGNGNITSAHQTWLMKYSQSLKFTPYIRMSYMTNASLTAKHNADILSQWPSEMVIGAGMTIGWSYNKIFIE